MAITWIASVHALDGAAAVGLGYIDYNLVYQNPKDLIEDMRKKRLAFAKFSFIMAVICLLMIDKPTKHSVFPLIVGQLYSTMKIGTQVAYNLTPDKFFKSRTMLGMYNLVFLIAIWYKASQSR